MDRAKMKKFYKAANLDLGDPKYKPTDLINDYAKSVELGISLLKELDEAEKEIVSQNILISNQTVMDMEMQKLQNEVDMRRKERKTSNAENTLLRELVRYQHELPMNEAGDYDENVKWEKTATQVLTQPGGKNNT